MSVRECPLCGKDLIGEEKFCRDCQEIAVNRFSPQLLNSSDEQVKDKVVEEIIPTPKKKSTKTAAAQSSNEVVESEAVAIPIPKKRGRPKKVKEEEKPEAIEEIVAQPIIEAVAAPQIEEKVIVDEIPPLPIQEIEEVKEEKSEEPMKPMKKEESTIIDDYDEDYYDEPYHSSRKLTLSIVAAAILGLSAGGVGTYMYFKEKFATERNTALEDSFWANAKEQNTRKSYNRYLTDYPTGKYSEEAETKISELSDNELKAWHSLRKSDNAYSYFNFLIENPDTELQTEIHSKIDSLSWMTVEKQKMADAYLSYLSDVKLGNIPGVFATQAEERYAYLSQIKTIEGDEAVQVKKAVNAFFKNLSENNYKEAEKAMNAKLTSFFGEKNKSNKMIVEWLKNNLKNNKIKSISYTADTDLTKITKDNKKVYCLSVPLEREVSYINKKKESSKVIINIELNGKKQIQSITLN